MFKGIIESIKGKRKISFSHWRYRLLHWTFRINPQTADDSRLPSFLYTHYCPLFHLTNILLLIAPIILCVRILTYLTGFLAIPISYALSLIDGAMQQYKTYTKSTKSPKAEELEDIYKFINRKIREYDIDYCTPEQLLYWYKLDYHTEIEFLDIAAKYLEKVKLRMIEQAEARKQYAAQMVFWINLSRTILKFAYVGIAALLLYFTVFTVLPFVWWLLLALFTVNWWSVLTTVLIAVTVIGCIAIPVIIFAYIVYKLEHSERVIFSSTQHFFKEVLGGFGVFLRECYDFVAALYENNCPPIEIVSGHDEEALAELDV